MTTPDEPVVIRCAVCGAALSLPVTRLPVLPERPDDETAPRDERATLPRGRWAVDPEPWASVDRDHPSPTRGTWVVAPADALDLAVHPDWRRGGGCCGHDGLDGPNRRCPGCHGEVATLVDDCWTPVELRLEPAAVVAVPSGPRDVDD